LAGRPRRKESSPLDDCQHADKLSLGMERDFEGKKNESGRRVCAPVHVLAGLEASHSREILGVWSRGAVEITFDDENRYIIVESVAAKICRRVIDGGHQVLG